jgi:uncharacterized Zn-binding protein involved in type VI secretion
MSVVRLGDLFGMGGIVTVPASSSVTVNGRPVALQGAIYTPHLGCSPKTPQHCIGVIFDMPAGVTIEGQVPLTKGAKGICGHSPTTASSDVFIVGGGFGMLGAIAGAVLGSMDFGSSDLGGLASGFADFTAPITEGLSSIGSVASSAVGGGTLGQIASGVATSSVTGIATGALNRAQN